VTLQRPRYGFRPWLFEEGCRAGLSPLLYLAGWCSFQAKQEFLRYPTRPSGPVTCLRCTLARGC